MLFVERLFDNPDAHPDIMLGGVHAHSFLLDARCLGLGMSSVLFLPGVLPGLCPPPLPLLSLSLPVSV